MNITSVENLSAVVAYKPKEIQVNKGVYDRVPDSHKEQFDNVLNNARSFYDKTVLEVKAKGEKPNAHTIKSESINRYINPFLQGLSLSTGIVRTKTSISVTPSTNNHTDKAKAAENSYNLTSKDLSKAKEFYADNTGVKELSAEEEINEAIQEESSEVEALPDFNSSLDFGDIFTSDAEVSIEGTLNQETPEGFGIEEVDVPDVLDETMNPSKREVDPLDMVDSDATLEVVPVDEEGEEVSGSDGFDFSSI